MECRVRLVSAILAKDEAGEDRYLRRVIERCFEFSDDVLVLDDNSTDATRDYAAELGCVVRLRSGMAAWGAEAPARAQLWDAAAELAGPDGWVLICDADMLLEGDPRPLCASWGVTGWAFPLVDLWDTEEQFRVDGPWGHGPRTPRPWLFKPGALTEPPVWPDRGVHCGHCPVNFPGPIGIAPDLWWKHLGWVRKEHRLRKHTQYLSVAHQLSEFERGHAQTILDDSPTRPPA
jgi:hypothetical protein